MFKRNGIHSICLRVCVLFLLFSGVFSSLWADSISLTYKQMTQRSGKQNSGTIQLTLQNSTEMPLEMCNLQLLFSSDVHVELREIPIAFLSSGGKITFVLPYRSSKNLQEDELLLSAELISEETHEKLDLALLAMR